MKKRYLSESLQQEEMDTHDNTMGDDSSSISVLSSSLPNYEDSFSRARSSSRSSATTSGQPIGPIVGTPPPGAMFPVSSVPRESSRPTQHRLSAQTPSASKRPQKPRSRWHFGIRSRCPVWEVMLEIYRSLQNVGMVCELVVYFHVALFLTGLLAMEKHRALPYPLPLSVSRFRSGRQVRSPALQVG